MRILVTGSRDSKDRDSVFSALDKVHALRGITLIIEGGQTGCDTFAREWAESRGICCKTEEADWNRYGRAAGPRRNAEMLKKWQPHGVVAFPGGKGTRDMCKRAENAGLTPWKPKGF
ncbi:MAG: DUF2493 domain-containing protein [Pseudomonadota bacterium]